MSAIDILLGERVAAALASSGVEITPEEALIRPSGRAGADYQCNAAMSLGKKLGKPPREVAQGIVDALDAPEVETAEVAGPGFINFTLSTAWLAQRLSSTDERLGVDQVAAPRRFALDYSSPNVAKEMHVGHLRSTIIGESLLRLLRFAGHEVAPHNHLGDWGTPFGMLIEHLADLGWSTTGSDHAIGDLNGFYQEARKKFDADPDFAERARLRVVALQSGDETTLALWRELVAESNRHFSTVYGLLGISLTEDDVYGESFYNPYLAEVIAEVEELGITSVSDGAVCVFPPGFANRDGDPLPLILRKRDGGYGYPVTDLATVRYWIRDRGMTDLLYVVGTPQAQHFQMVFAASRMAGYLGPDNTAVHIGFGTILGEDGKTIRTRAGGTLKLVDLLDEAVQHATALVAERSQLDPEDQAAVARAVGLGAVKYADLSGDREKDYTFTWERMLATDGNTSVYLQYANARIHSILRKAGSFTPSPMALDAPAERALGLKLAQFPSAVAAAVEGYAPHKLCQYLFETATAFTGFYENCPILADSTPEPVRASRLALAALTSAVLTRGLDLLGIEAPTRM